MDGGGEGGRGEKFGGGVGEGALWGRGRGKKDGGGALETGARDNAGEGEGKKGEWGDGNGEGAGWIGALTNCWWVETWCGEGKRMMRQVW